MNIVIGRDGNKRSLKPFGLHATRYIYSHNEADNLLTVLTIVLDRLVREL